jgi:hypothetical protein
MDRFSIKRITKCLWTYFLELFETGTCHSVATEEIIQKSGKLQTKGVLSVHTGLCLHLNCKLV